MKALSIITTLLIINSCSAQSNEKQFKNYDKPKMYKFYSRDSLIVLNIKVESDSLIGDHCFISGDGNRIDCCTTERQSLFLKRKTNELFEGEMLSCYDDRIYKIRIEILKDRMYFYLVKDDHDFIQARSMLFENTK